MDEFTGEKIRTALELCKIRISNLEESKDSSDELSVIYNKLIVEKAVLEHSIASSSESILAKIKKILPKKNKNLISDWF